MNTETWVMWHPSTAYRFLVKQSGGDRSGIRALVNRPLFFAFLIGCTVSLLTSATLTARLAAPAMLNWSFVPIIEIASLAVVCRRTRRNTPFPHLVDLFFRGCGPWSAWLIGLSVIWAFLSPITVASHFSLSRVWLYGGGIAAAAWSAFIDLSFFRFVLERDPRSAVRDLVFQRAISWGLIAPILGAPTIWSEVVGRIPF